MKKSNIKKKKSSNKIRNYSHNRTDANNREAHNRRDVHSRNHAHKKIVHKYNIKDEIIEGTVVEGKNIKNAQKELDITDKQSYKYNTEELLRRIFLVEQKKKKKPEINKSYLKKILSQAGYEIDPDIFKKKVLRYNIIIIALWSLYLIINGLISGLYYELIFPILVSWIVFFPALLLLTWGVIFLVLDYKKYKRKKELEEVWPEYLQLVVSNINAGMLIDVALWSAVKPKYKVLAKEIEQVAKQTLTGKELSEALQEFAEKYDSVMVKRTINLLIEGMESGGKIATLLNKVALDIQDTKIMRKEMSASVMTYAIFISFATIVAAPFLFALSTQLLTVIQTIIGKLGQTSTTSVITFSAENVKIEDFKIFAYIMLTITSFMSACLIGSIRKGSIKDGLKYIPIFIITTLIIYHISTIILSSLFSSLL